MTHGTQLCMSVKDFCALHTISRASFYRMVRAGEGPRIIKVGSRTLISTEAASDWRHKREHQQAA